VALDLKYNPTQPQFFSHAGIMFPGWKKLVIAAYKMHSLIPSIQMKTRLPVEASKEKQGPNSRFQGE
jgi:hypothetical protein